MSIPLASLLDQSVFDFLAAVLLLGVVIKVVRIGSGPQQDVDIGVGDDRNLHERAAEYTTASGSSLVGVSLTTCFRLSSCCVFLIRFRLIMGG